MFAERFGILEQDAMRLMINGLLHTWLWWQTNSCSAVLEINHDILLIWNRFNTLYFIYTYTSQYSSSD